MTGVWCVFCPRIPPETCRDGDGNPVRWEADAVECYFFSQVPNPMGHPPSTSSADEQMGMSQHPFGIEPQSNSWCDTGKRVARSLDRAAGYYQSRSVSSRGFDGCRALRLETWGLIVASLPCQCSSRGRGSVRRRDEGRLLAKTTSDDAVKNCACSPTRAPNIFVCRRGPSVTETTPRAPWETKAS